jgi:hypothetical protein
MANRPVKRPAAPTTLILATSILAGVVWSAVECLDVQATGAVRFALARQWPLFWLTHFSIGIAACLIQAGILDVGAQLADSLLGRWIRRPTAGVVLFAVHGLVWAGACVTGLHRGRALLMLSGLLVIAASSWALRGPLPWREEGARPHPLRHWLWSAASFAAVLAAHGFNRVWNTKIYFPLHVAVSLFSVTAALYGAAHFWQALRRFAVWRPLGAAAAIGTVVAVVASSVVLVRLSNDVRHVLFSRAFDAKAVLYVARKLRGSGTGQATAMPAAAEIAVAPGRKRVDRVLLLSIDTVRADHLPSYGYGRDTAPEIARLASTGAVFDWAWSAGATTSLALEAIFGRNGGRPSLTRQLEQAGIPRRAVLAAPFHHYTGGLDSIEVPAGAGDAAVAAVAAREIEAGRFDGFMWVHFFDAHRPYQKHSGTLFGSRPIDLYDGEIRSTDRAVGQVLQALARAHLDESTAVILVADHGEEFGEHGGEAHGWDIYNELIHVPLVVRMPGGRVGHVPMHVTQRDLPFTITELLGVAPGAPGPDRSLVPLLLGQAAPDRVVMTAPISSFNVGVLLAGRWKLAYCLFNDSRALFDLAADPDERVNLFEARSDVAGPLEALLQRSLGDPARLGGPLLAGAGDFGWRPARP